MINIYIYMSAIAGQTGGPFWLTFFKGIYWYSEGIIG